MRIENDVLDIAARVREIDKNYYIEFNIKSKKFELFLKGGEKLLVFPYDRLDERAVVHARKTRIERIDKLIAEIDMHNLKIEKEAEKKSKFNIKDRVEEGVKKYVK